MNDKDFERLMKTSSFITSLMFLTAFAVGFGLTFINH